MTEFSVFCDSCYSLYSPQNAKFVLAHCGHMYCQKCLDKDILANGRCVKGCSRKGEIRPFNSQLPSDTKLYFDDYGKLLKKALRVHEHQNNRLRDYCSHMSKENDELRATIALLQPDHDDQQPKPEPEIKQDSFFDNRVFEQMAGPQQYYASRPSVKQEPMRRSKYVPSTSEFSRQSGASAREFNKPIRLPKIPQTRLSAGKYYSGENYARTNWPQSIESPMSFGSYNRSLKMKK